MSKVAIIIFVVAVLILFYIVEFSGMLVADKVIVTRIIDGDTIEIESGERVRLLGIDTPERGQFLYEEASERLNELIGNSYVTLEADEEDKDKYDRLLRHIFIGETHVNEILVREGFAKTLFIPPNEKYNSVLLEAEEFAKEKKIGIFSFEDIPYAYCISMYYFSFNAPGDDRQNINGEFVEFKNKCDSAVDMDGWVIEDEASHNYVFPEFVVQPDAKFRLHSGVGIDNQSSLFWNSNKPIWNNDGDSITVLNENKEVLIEYSYKGY